MTERKHLDMIEPAIRGVVTSVYEERHFVVNNKYLSDNRPSEESTFALCVDANNLYGGFMRMDMLPVGEFAFNVEITLNEILNTPNDASFGFFLEVDLNYPVHLHDDHRDFPLAPTKETVQDDWLGEYQLELKDNTDYPARMLKSCFKRCSTKRTMYCITNCSNYTLVLD